MENQERPLSEADPLVRVAHAILRAAVGEGATELRLMPGSKDADGKFAVSVQCLVGGLWSDLPFCPQFPGNIYGNILRRFQILADVNPFSSKGPQEGCFRFRDESEGQPSREYLIRASFQQGQGGITTVLTIEDGAT